MVKFTADMPEKALFSYLDFDPVFTAVYCGYYLSFSFQSIAGGCQQNCTRQLLGLHSSFGAELLQVSLDSQCI